MVNTVKLKLLLAVILISLNTGVLANNVQISDDNKKLLNAFHSCGMKHCDSFILKSTSLTQSSQHYTMTWHPNFKDKNVTEVGLIIISGKKGDTVKWDNSFIQTPNACFVRQKITRTLPGDCSNHIDLNHWYIFNEMRTTDYTEYKNQGGISMYVKEVTVGNFKTCVQEYVYSNEGKRD